MTTPASEIVEFDPLPPNGLWAHWPWLRRFVSAWLAFHLVALVVAPLAVAPTSQLCEKIWLGFRPYLEALYLNHGYHFFAPEPGPGHLVRYDLRFPDGHVESGVFPDATKHRPRLLYHRHFMLSEYLNSLAVSEQQRELFEATTRSYAEHLRLRHGANEVTLNLRRHYVPGPQHVLSGKPLSDVSLFAERPLGTFTTERR